MKHLSQYTDREIALLLGALHADGRCGKAGMLISEAAYRLVRAGGGAMNSDQERLAEDVHTYDFRLREAQRAQRRLQAEQPEASSSKKVISIGAR